MKKFIQNLENLLQTITKNNLQIIIIGDFNINILDENSSKTKQFKDLLSTFNLKWLINSPTRISNISETAIDNIISNMDNINAQNVITSISDHYAQAVFIQDWLPECPLPLKKVRRKTNISNIEQLIYNLEQEQWDCLLTNIETNVKFTFFNDIFLRHLNNCCPLKTIIEKTHLKRNTWITRGIRKSSKTMKHLTKSLKQNYFNNDFVQFVQNYKRIYRKVLRAAKAYDINKKLKYSTNLSKTSWKIIKESNNKHMAKPIAIEENNEIFKEPKKISNIFNDFYLSVVDSIITSSKTTNMSKKYLHNDSKICSSMFILPVVEAEVLYTINQLKPKKSTDINGIAVFHLKKIASAIVKPLTILINDSFETGIFPDILKLSKVVPVFKKGNPYLTTNYRPVSLLPVLSKVYERLFLDRLLNFLDKFKIISNNQYGFRKDISSVEAIFKLVEKITTDLDSQHSVSSIFLDLSKAFDCVNHNILLQKLSNYGIRNVPLTWIKSYLQNREQCVEVSGELSEIKKIKHGVPQGSILGPVLFLIYVNETKSSLTHGNIIQYADDTTLSFSSNDSSQLEIQIHENLNNCVQFFNEHNLITNFEKSTYINFSTLVKSHLDLPTVMIDNFILKEVKSTKFLGLIVDNKLKWTDHINYISSKISKNIYILRNISRYCTSEVKLIAYYGLIYCYLSYGIIIWGKCPDNDFKRLFVLQKRALRVITRTPARQSCKPIFQELSVLTLPSIYLLETACFCRFKCDILRGNDIHNHDTRFNYNMRPTQHKLKLFENLPNQFGKRIINKLPNNIKFETNPNIFKNKLKNLLLSENVYSIQEFMNIQF
jgi:hypothetical protein